MKKELTIFLGIFLIFGILASFPLVLAEDNSDDLDNCQGCFQDEGDKCYPYGFIKDGKYCTFKYNYFKNLKKYGEKCEDDFECETEICLDNSICTTRRKPLIQLTGKMVDNESEVTVNCEKRNVTCYVEAAISANDKDICDLIDKDMWPVHTEQCYEMVEAGEISAFYTVDPIEFIEVENVTRICCHSYGLGAMMVKVNSEYEVMQAKDCAVPEDWAGGGKEIVDDSYCEDETEIEITIGGKKIKIRTSKKNIAKVQAALQKRNKLEINQSDLPSNCHKTGSVIKCDVDGGRVMAIMAGRSGNTIIQVRGINMTTRAELYHHDGKVYGIFKDNQTKVIEYFPDQIREIIRVRIHAQIEGNETIELNEEGEYEVEVKKRSRFLGIFKVKEKVRFHVDPETGEILNERAPWWSFLAKDIDKETVSEAELDVCEIDEEYESTVVIPTPCECPEGYEFEIVSQGFGPCLQEGKTDCPSSTLKCVKE